MGFRDRVHRALTQTKGVDAPGVTGGKWVVNLPMSLDNGTGAVSSSGLLMGRGTTADPVTTSTADAKFFEWRCQSSATSGDNRMLYMRYELSGTGGGECIRAFTKIQGTIGTARGAHISLDIDATVGDKVTGLAAGVDAQILLGNKTAEAGIGAHCALNVEIYGAGASTDYATANKLSFIRFSMAGGHADAITDIDDDAYLFDIVGATEGAGNMVIASNTEANYVSAAKCRINGVEKWLMFASASG
jgi:hypothetical protein